MSVIIAVRKNGVACLAADTMTSYGNTLEGEDLIVNHRKIQQVGETHIASVGSPAFSLIFNSYFARAKRKPNFKSPQEIFEVFRRMHQTLKEDYYLRTEENEEAEFESSRVQCLLANAHGIFGVYDLRDVSEYRKFYAFGSGANFALGAMEALYDDLSSAEEIARRALTAAAKLDNASALPMTVVTVKMK